jgi:NADH-quinone oxidoreductase subunit N
VIGAFYYLKIIKTMYFDTPVDEIAPSVSLLERAIMMVAAVIIVGGYLAIQPLGIVADAAAKALF